MKILKQTGFIILILGLAYMPLFINGCTHDDEMDTIIPPTTFEYGDDFVSTSDGYTFDHTHSSVRWETAYFGTAALLTGRFNDFALDVDFTQNAADISSLSGWVTLTSVNTGEPGRDQGCLMGTFDVATQDTATFVSTSITEDGKGGYIVEGELNFHSVTAPVSGTLEYAGTTYYDENSGVRNAPLYLSGFIVEFEFLAKSIFGIESDNIADGVKIIASGQFKKPG